MTVSSMVGCSERDIHKHLYVNWNSTASTHLAQPLMGACACRRNTSDIQRHLMCIRGHEIHTDVQKKPSELMYYTLIRIQGHVATLTTSCQREGAAKSRDGRREEVLATPRNDPLDGQRKCRALGLGVCARHETRANTVRTIVVLANDGVKAGCDRLLEREAGVVLSACYDGRATLDLGDN